jgi:hypothetical protein
MKILIMQFSPTSYSFVSLQPKYSNHHQTPSVYGEKKAIHVTGRGGP